MARTRTITNPRLEQLRAARKRIRKGETLTAEPMASLLSLSWKALGDKIAADPGVPIVQRGSRGVEWQFDARAVVDYFIRLEEAEARKARRVAELGGLGAAGADVVASMGLADLAKADAVATSVQRKKIEQGEYMPRTRVVQAFDRYTDTVVSQFLNVTHRIDPTGALPVEVRAMLDNEMRNVLLALHDAASREMAAFGAVLQSGANRARP